jgi:cob(I)alamin adenosyltransferase
MSSKIYTKTGDNGTTSLIGGTKVLKSDLRIEAYGTVDELNSYIGLCRDLVNDVSSKKILKEIQDRLFTIGSSLACDPQKEPKMKIPDLKEEDIHLLEKEMDKMGDSLPEMKHFILPGGHPTISHIHIARCVCRRTERNCVRLQNETREEDVLIIKYLNRLGDYLFILARHISRLLNAEEIPWKPRV